ncbi:uncharacterized protein YukE [Marinobacter sp. MBR-99]|jgi:uncharacterized protein YukE|uniref:hypothetical protein n=1 Tax=Marinobacter sp. MBR-99 TaxID=3156461 RepID=UPI003398059B
MIRTGVRGLLIALVALVLAGCSKPETPQEVAAAFWQAMADNDAGDVVKFSTLDDTRAFDGYQRSWANAVPSFGRVVIDEREATIITRLPAEERSSGERLELTTYLVREQNQWLVDYDRTGEAILNPSPFSNIMGELSRLGQRLSATFSSSTREFEDKMEQLARDLETYSDEMSRRAESAVEDFARRLQVSMRALERSLDEALRDDRPESAEDQAIMEQAARDLERQADELSQPTMEVLANASRTVAETAERFSRLSRETLNRYQEELNEKLAEMRADAEAFIEDIRP